MKLKIILFILLLILCAGVFYIFLNFGQIISREKLTTGQVIINDKVINVEVARTPSQQSLGLGSRQFLAPDNGMLFVFSDVRARSFWMKGMEFPLDIIWIKDNTIIGIEANAPIPFEKQETLPVYSSPSEVNYVLEVNAGFCEQNNIKIGDEVIFNLN